MSGLLRGGILAFCLGLIVTELRAAPVAADPVFSDHMVLQRDIPCPVWGTATPGSAITITFGEQSKTGKADENGRWMVRLDPMDANSNPKELFISGPDGEVAQTIRDVLVGDVFLCAGQSNMDGWLGHVPDSASANFPMIRHSKHGKEWMVCSPATAPKFSSVAFYFARRVHGETGVPIGLLNNSIGGSTIEQWFPPESLDLDPQLKAQDEAQTKAFLAKIQEDGSKRLLDAEAWVRSSREALQAVEDRAKRDTCLTAVDAVETWIGRTRRAIEEKGRVPMMPSLPNPAHFPMLPAFPESWKGVDNRRGYCGQYFDFMQPLIGYGIRSMLWYQGESNGSDGDSYAQKLEALVGGLRRLWGQGDFPLYIVQLPGLGEATDDPAKRGGKTRIGQLKSLRIPNTGMIVTIDLGGGGNLHPAVIKPDVGYRLASLVLAKDYGKDIPYSGPLYRDHKIEGNAIRVFFDHAESGLMVGERTGNNPAVISEEAGGKLKRFALAEGDPDKPATWRWVWGVARIDGETVVVSSPEIANPVAVYYAYGGNPEGANLYNRHGLPASPFRTADFE